MALRANFLMKYFIFFKKLKIILYYHDIQASVLNQRQYITLIIPFLFSKYT